MVVCQEAPTCSSKHQNVVIFVLILIHFGYKTHAETTIHDTRLLLAALALGIPPVPPAEPRKNTLLLLYPP